MIYPSYCQIELLLMWIQCACAEHRHNFETEEVTMVARHKRRVLFGLSRKGHEIEKATKQSVKKKTNSKRKHLTYLQSLNEYLINAVKRVSVLSGR